MEQIFTLRNILEQCMEWQGPISVCELYCLQGSCILANNLEEWCREKAKGDGSHGVPQQHLQNSGMGGEHF